jgi:putative glutamine amidotransferase
MRPRIGITRSTNRCGDRDVEAVERAYVAAVSNAGGLPFVLPVLDPADAQDVVDGLGGLLLAGGGDVDPACYGEATGPEVAGVDAGRDAYELALVRSARQRRVPVLGVCRGLQIANVAHGGSLIQHLPFVTSAEHRDDARSHEAVHPVVVEPGTPFAALVGAPLVDVNSLHHQAVDRVGVGLSVVARGLDGTIEALASDDAGFVGVQWHPELLADMPVSGRLFEWLVDAAASEATRPVRARRARRRPHAAEVSPLAGAVA